MTREETLQVVLRYIRSNVYGLDGQEIDPSQSMMDLGASSLDIVEIVSASMRELQIRIPRAQLIGLKNINELVDVLHRVQQEGAG
jgi:acyl carrier protein